MSDNPDRLSAQPKADLGQAEQIALALLEEHQRLSGELSAWMSRTSQAILAGGYLALAARLAQAERAKATLLRWCEEDGGAVKGYVSHADIRYALDAADSGEAG